MVATTLSVVSLSLFLSAIYVVQRLQVDVDVDGYSRQAEIDLFDAELRQDTLRSAVIFCWPYHLRVNGSTFKEAAWAGSSFWTNPTDAITGLTAYYAGQGKTLAGIAPNAGETKSCLLFLGPDNRVVSYWEFSNKETNLNGVVALETRIERYANTGASELQRLRNYVQTLPTATLAKPGGSLGGPVGGRWLTGSEHVNGQVQVTFPSPVLAGKVLAYANRELPETANAQSMRRILRPHYQPTF